MNKSLGLNFWPILYDSIVFLCFSNTESLSETKRDLTFRMGQKIKLQTRFQIFTKYWYILHILYFHKVV